MNPPKTPALSRLTPEFQQEIDLLCHTWHITELSLFGSIVTIQGVTGEVTVPETQIDIGGERV
ncbi:hypothetical protein [Prochlorothrix hollandica]|uniref:Uncharacterized protein n=1 Tax=Prochlorothrix hollandica PCC 9006 = CALU 1027 TaxID=317619 RepID=A0A0M2PYC9_PROHO|nr:hypothetical protein [Prochlorothrix hollandica]KKI99688.1 hypothetical protein PROH_07300 [Prochlorothrix hollandica PCC 9006 = CALU 1027]